MTKVIITVGISGSGKSTWTKDYLQKKQNFLRINRDDIRTVLVGDLAGYYKRKDLFMIENIVTNLEEDVIGEILNLGKNVIVDNTNLNKKYINRWLDWLKSNKSIDSEQVKFKLFPVDLNVAIYRVAIRDFGWNGVGWNETLELSTAYIKKQYEDYKKIEDYILKNHPENIIQ